MKTVTRMIILGVILFGANKAFGCSCGAITPAEGFDRAKAVFTGTIVKVTKAE